MQESGRVIKDIRISNITRTFYFLKNKIYGLNIREYDNFNTP